MSATKKPVIPIKLLKNNALIPLSKKSTSSSSENIFNRKLTENDKKELDMFLKVLSPIEPLKFTISIISDNSSMGIPNRVVGQIVHTFESKKDNTSVANVDSINLLPALEDVVSHLDNCFVSEKEQYLQIPVKAYNIGQEYSLRLELGGRSTGAAKSTVAALPFEDIIVTLVNQTSETTTSTTPSTTSQQPKSDKKKKPSEQEVMMKLLLEQEDANEKKKQSKKGSTKKK